MESHKSLAEKYCKYQILCSEYARNHQLNLKRNTRELTEEEEDQLFIEYVFDSCPVCGCKRLKYAGEAQIRCVDEPESVKMICYDCTRKKKKIRSGA